VVLGGGKGGVTLIQTKKKRAAREQAQHITIRHAGRPADLMAQRYSNSSSHDALTKASGASPILVSDQTRIQGPWKGKA